MSISQKWEQFYSDKSLPIGTYPTLEKLVSSLVSEAPRMLEIGAGLGCEIPFFTQHMRFGYNGVDGSQAAILRLQNMFPWLANNLRVADFTKEIPFKDGFDLIVDRASIPHNDLASIRSCLALVHKALNPGGLLICSDWFSTYHSEFTRGNHVDSGTREGYPDGQFRNADIVHFSDEKEIAELFSEFEGIFLEERISRRAAPNDLVTITPAIRWISPHFRNTEYRSAVWDIVVRKPL